MFIIQISRYFLHKYVFLLCCSPFVNPGEFSILAELLWKAPLFTPLIRKIHLSDQGNVVAAVSVLLAPIVKDVS